MSFLPWEPLRRAAVRVRLPTWDLVTAVLSSGGLGAFSELMAPWSKEVWGWRGALFVRAGSSLRGALRTSEGKGGRSPLSCQDRSGHLSSWRGSCFWGCSQGEGIGGDLCLGWGLLGPGWAQVSSQGCEVGPRAHILKALPVPGPVSAGEGLCLCVSLYRRAPVS